ncbi:nucleotidyltransferase family protein [Caldivirga maquilingensis]|uniref:DNA polymerase beta domain protein region n=1 Tax=Caldivirga maquilingensis (strain ATCC 700844 / DSM 13496 / JCM 10307 / IC-167) TaxID=397948 RepID=A8M944_CALMQ|nr:nucleotidyltransferase domain-containing protein [Caldivirga maquilingensis]ABW02263.1 DNA polymerase beta domain protein region [Caldivirga maquilingensis IC-167]
MTTVFKYYRLNEEERRRVAEKLREVLVTEGVKLAIIFGSFIELGSFRDIDIAVYLEDPGDLDKILRLGVKLEDTIKIPVDVVPIQELPPKLRHKILTKGMVILEEPGMYEALWSQTMDELTIMNTTNTH